MVLLDPQIFGQSQDWWFLQSGNLLGSHWRCLLEMIQILWNYELFHCHDKMLQLKGFLLSKPCKTYKSQSMKLIVISGKKLVVLACVSGEFQEFWDGRLSTPHLNFKLRVALFSDEFLVLAKRFVTVRWYFLESLNSEPSLRFNVCPWNSMKELSQSKQTDHMTLILLTQEENKLAPSYLVWTLHSEFLYKANLQSSFSCCWYHMSFVWFVVWQTFAMYI